MQVRGIVQGVGFRPFVYRLAQELGLAGWVRNGGGGVEMEVQGSPGNVSALFARMRGEAPPLARIDEIAAGLCDPIPGDHGFTISASDAGEITTAIGHDTAVCKDCLDELFDPRGRRWRYPFINCTHCGPRYTITYGLPYDRADTSMARFEMCPECLDEYQTPSNRRFHAEPNACAACGPRLQLLEAYGITVATRDPIADALLRILCGEIVAIKGLGGFHLVCDARNPEAVERLRCRKSREAKPFALMVANLASARHWARLTPAEEDLLATPERPIVLARKLPAVDRELYGIAPELAWVGLMLPYTPLHYLLFHDHVGRPGGTRWLDLPNDLTLVCTSANPGSEPIVTQNHEATRRLMGIADAYLMHDRDIVACCEDSVLRVVAAPQSPAVHGEAQFIRRARGYVPRAIRLPLKGPSVLALGAYLNNALCLTRGDEAFLSAHIGDLENAATCTALDDTADHLQTILAVQPEALACDLHPDFHSTRLAGELAERLDLPLVQVQHHHAHIAATLAEHGHRGPALGLALDGVGLGEDGTAWGGELLRVDGPDFERLGHLAPLPLPGGDRAAREPWRMAAAALHRMGRGREIARRFRDEKAAQMLEALLAKGGASCPPTSSMGRYFDAAAGLLDICRRLSFEGQAAMQLEGLAESYGPCLAVPGAWTLDADGVLDLLPLLELLIGEPDAARGAARFHATLAAALEAWVMQAVTRSGISTLALGGGCFNNRLLASALALRLRPRGIRVLAPRQAPPGDGGIALGQAWVAIQTLYQGV